MPRYFFHVYDDAVTMDEDGQELPSIEAARQCAIESARSLVCSDISRGYLNLDHSIEVQDEHRQTVLVLTYREAFTNEGHTSFLV
jgi:hypothetical protein